MKLKLALFLLLISLVASPILFSKVQAGIATPRKLTLSDSRAGATGVTQDYAFTTSATTAIKQVDISVCTTPSGSCVAPSGYSAGTPTLASNNIAGAGRTTTAPTANAMRIVVTTPAAQATQAVTLSFTGTTNPSTVNTTYFARVTIYSDAGTTIIDGPDAIGFAILDTTSISVTATIDPTLTFSIAPVTSGATVNGATANITTTATTIPFGTLVATSPKIGAHDVTVTSNAGVGYVITVKGATTPVLTSGSDNIDEFTGTNAAPATWSSPAGTSNSVNTGFFGYTTNDTTLGTGTATRFTSAGPKWAGTSATPGEVAYSAIGVTSEVTRIGWQTEVNSLQAPGSYSGSVILVATPTY
ncbi:MAG: hypothetical protein WCL07_01365 [bacterium]